MGEALRTRLPDVCSKSDFLDTKDGEMAALEKFLKDCLDGILISGPLKEVEMAAGRMTPDLFGTPTGGTMIFGALKVANARAGRTETVITVVKKKKSGTEGRIDCVSERSSSTKLLLFPVTETILSPA